VCSGGRYDGLVAQLGGDPVPAIGWALGEERIVELMRLSPGATAEASVDVYLALAGEAAERTGLRLAEQLRDALPGLRVETNCGGGSFKSQLKRADRSGARLAVILATTRSRAAWRPSSRCARTGSSGRCRSRDSPQRSLPNGPRARLTDAGRRPAARSS